MKTDSYKAQNIPSSRLRMGNVHFMSQRLDWQTPKAVYDELDKEFHFDFDPCPHNPTFDGLAIEWGKSNFVNPPYGRKITEWIVKGCAQYLQGKTVVFLIPSRTDTKWWHQYIMVHAKEIRFIKGRLKFGNSTNSAPFPSAIVILRGNNLGYLQRKCSLS